MIFWKRSLALFSVCWVDWSRPTDIIGAAYVVTRSARAVSTIANRDRDRARITPVIRPTIIRPAIIRSVARGGAVIPFAPRYTERGENQNQHESRPCQFNPCPA